MMLDIDKLRKVTKPDYRKKIGLSKKYENVVKVTVFRILLENSSNDFAYLWSECREDRYRVLQQTAGPKKFLFKIFIHKVVILAKNGQSGVERSNII